ncbi:hypothetical protein HDU99_010451 [Rhizoclosmatium hyalinum]|nr:hypothetical protein HDU99_010451 [Rhizoclosmatium hyalinum]
MIGQSALEQLCRQYVVITNKVATATKSPAALSQSKGINELRQSIIKNKSALNDAINATFGATAAINTMSKFTTTQVKAQRQQNLISAQQREAKLRSDISAEESLLAKLESGEGVNAGFLNEWFLITSKLLVVANDLDEIVYTKILEQVVSEYYETVKETYDVVNALRQVSYSIFAYDTFSPNIAASDEYYSIFMVYSAQHLSNAVAIYPPLASIGVNPGLKDRGFYLSIAGGMGEMAHSGRDFLNQQLHRLRKQLLEKEASLIKTSNHVRAIRIKLITSLFASCNIYSAESLDVENALEFDHRDLQSISNISLDVEPGSANSVRYVRDALTKKDIGKAVGILYPTLEGSVREASNDLPPYK